MGTSRIHITNLIGDFESKSVFEIPVDSTLGEVIALVNLSVFEFQTNESNDQLLLYDCTLYPPKDISDIVLQYTESTGPKSITIQSLGWFPSATLLIFRGNDFVARGHLMSNIHTDEDFEYNLPSRTHANCETNGIQSITRKLKPSEILLAVENRKVDTLSSADNIQPLKKITSKKISEHERREKIHQRLKKLENKNDKVSAQVKNMLIKSGAQGDKKIRMEDRFYLDTILLDERTPSLESSSSKYCFYSRVGTMGQVISSRTLGLNMARNHIAEVLLIDSKRGEESFWRLSAVIPLFEAEEKGILKQYDRVIVRVYDNTFSSETPLVDMNHNKVENVTLNEFITGCSNNRGLDEEEKIIQSIREMDSKTASTDVSDKIRQMIFKAKAKGDKKIKMSSRFYFEKITINSNFEAQSEFIFVEGNQSTNVCFETPTKCYVFTKDKLTSINLHCSHSIQTVVDPFSRLVVFSI